MDPLAGLPARADWIRTYSRSLWLEIDCGIGAPAHEPVSHVPWFYVARSCGLAFGMARSAKWTCCRSWRVIASVSVPGRQLSNPSRGTSTCTHVPGKRTRISMCPMPSPGNQCVDMSVWTATIRIVDNCFSMAQHQPNPLVCTYAHSPY